MKNLLNDPPLTDNERDAVAILVKLNEEGRVPDDEFEDRLIQLLGRERADELWEWTFARLPWWQRLAYRVRERGGR